jgi:hypothetical protein
LSSHHLLPGVLPDSFQQLDVRGDFPQDAKHFKTRVGALFDFFNGSLDITHAHNAIDTLLQHSQPDKNLVAALEATSLHPVFGKDFT